MRLTFQLAVSWWSLIKREIYRPLQSFFKMEISQCPVVRPTEAEFYDFWGFIQRLDQTYSKDFGMIVPPSSWKPQAQDYEKRLQNLWVRHPIEQNVQGKGGFYESKNIVQPKMTLKKYKKYAEKESSKVQQLSTQEKERMFWKTITYSSPVYGADLTGSLMDGSAGSWNLNNLDSILKHALTDKVKGVTDPYCYIGSWKAFFSWHKEDLDLGALNYIHEGASKLWYAISPDHSHILEHQASSFFKTQARECPEFLRHKTFLINPETLLQKHKDLKITKIQHKAGEIIMVFGGAYHEGFNLGFNIAEAVNYGTNSWLEVLPAVKFCKCFKKCVRGEVQSILYNLQHSSLYPEIASLAGFQQLQQHVFENQIKEQAECGIAYPEGTFFVEDKAEEAKKEIVEEIGKAEGKKVKTKKASSLKTKKTKKVKKTGKNVSKKAKKDRKEEEKENQDVENQGGALLLGGQAEMIN